jgi:superfamily II DNA or RNA helicase
MAGFRSRDELLAWAREHQVEHALGLPARAAAEHAAPQYRYLLSYQAAHMTIADLACAEHGTQRSDAQLTHAFAAAARARLEAERSSVLEGLREEAARPLRAPTPEVAPLWDRLLELRRVQRVHARPRGPTQRRFGTWSFDLRELRISWTDPEQRYRGYPLAPPTTLSFVSEQPVLACDCGEHACTHRLALIDATLDVLADPAQRAVAIQATRELLRPGWSRVLEALERVVADKSKPAASVEVWWQINAAPVIEVVPIVRKLGKRGTLTSGARTNPERLLAEFPQLDPRDRDAAQLLASFQLRVQRDSYPHRAIAALVGHPRVRSTNGEAPVEVRRSTLGLAARSSNSTIQLTPVLDGEPLELRRLAGLFESFDREEPLFAIEADGSCVLIEVDRHVRAVCEQILAHGNAFPSEAHDSVLDAITKLDGHLPVAVSAELKGIEHPLTPTVVLRMRLVHNPRVAGSGDASLQIEALIRPCAGAPLFRAGEGRRDVLIVRDGVRGHVRRRLDDEHALIRERLVSLPLQHAEETAPNCFSVAHLDEALDLVKALERPPEGVEAQWVDERPRVRSRGGTNGLRLEIRRERDWFGIAGSLTIDEDRLELAVLLDAMRREQRYVRVGPSSWVELTEELRKRLLPVADHTHATRDRLEISLGALPAVGELIEAGVHVEAAPAWTLAARRLAAAQELQPRPPASLRKILRPYQAEGHAWLTRVAAWGAGACLADDMGLGKTLQTIAVLVDRAKLGPAIVLAPTSVTSNWVKELARFAPKLRPVLLTEQGDRAASLARLGKHDVLIVSYGLLVREGDRLAELHFATLVADEAQALKNPETQRAKAARRVDADFRIALTGTPLENHLGELWSIFAIVFPGLLGSWEQFRTRFALPIERGATAADPIAEAEAQQARAALARVLRPFLLRRTKAEVARELPARTEIEVPIDMSPEERDLYEDARLAAVAHLTAMGKSVRDEQRRFQVIAALTRLRLLASHPKLYDPTSSVPSSKLQRLLELVEELREGGHRALIFSQFTKHLQLVRDELDRLGIASLYLDGETPTKERARRIDAFQAGTADLFLISLKAGGTGINLTGADYVIHLDPWWNPAVEDQATDRAHRIGQTKPVTVYRLITRGTVEDKILALHGKKRQLVAQVLEGTGAAAKIGTDDLLALLADS